MRLLNWIKSRAVTFWRMIQWAWNFPEFERNLIAERERHKQRVEYLEETRESRADYLIERHQEEIAQLAKVVMFRDVLEAIGFDFDADIQKVSAGSNEGFGSCQHIDVQFTVDDELKSMHIVSIDTSGVKVEV